MIIARRKSLLSVQKTHFDPHWAFVVGFPRDQTTQWWSKR
uniref:Uncharacterized protein n=1 Tax=Anguilla anguilla TaxID=7936 RepID=A0A0E9QSH4_ANGAN